MRALIPFVVWLLGCFAEEEAVKPKPSSTAVAPKPAEPNETMRQMCQTVKDKAQRQVEACEANCPTTMEATERDACIDGCPWDDVEAWNLVAVRCAPLVGGYSATVK